MVRPCSKCGGPVLFISEQDVETHIEIFGWVLCLACRVVEI